ncbi:class I SAM-dependent methyltransferase [Ahrensia sp. R2A130]|uniref:class I SAM-dependent methyltransferase n=1 Tax=Ahrensia sp. R2A130 TaxID=744979 RepID=UPI0001E0E8E7|nr:class I SAM-dependent methyltransferase [Ahrensia sp. R2A130]EFL88001.1 ATP synthase subunits region ORF 4 [Ahrensia sp. R2A130]
MQMDIVDLRQFYATPLGAMARRSVQLALTSLWKPLTSERLVGLGYATPWLDAFRADAERTLALMPARQGAVHWPFGEDCATALVFDEDLPLADASIDRMLLVHALEHFENVDEALSEIWRVLAPGGKLIIVVPNRRGVWARMEHTPYGSGRPWSGGQLSKLLRSHMFTPTSWSDALHFPPSSKKLASRFAPTMERFGRRFVPAFAGVLVVEATKQVYQGLPVRQRQSRRVFVPVLAPQGASSTGSNTNRTGRDTPSAKNAGVSKRKLVI